MLKTFTASPSRRKNVRKKKKRIAQHRRAFSSTRKNKQKFLPFRNFTAIAAVASTIAVLAFVVSVSRSPQACVCPCVFVCACVWKWDQKQWPKLMNLTVRLHGNVWAVVISTTCSSFRKWMHSVRVRLRKLNAHAHEPRITKLMKNKRKTTKTIAHESHWRIETNFRHHYPFSLMRRAVPCEFRWIFLFIFFSFRFCIERAKSEWKNTHSRSAAPMNEQMQRVWAKHSTSTNEE